MKTHYIFSSAAPAVALDRSRAAQGQIPSAAAAQQTAIEDTTVKFNFWLVVVLALLPVLAMFVGMSVSADFPSAIDWDVIAAIVGGVGIACGLARRALDRTRAAERRTIDERSIET